MFRTANLQRIDYDLKIYDQLPRFCRRPVKPVRGPVIWIRKGVFMKVSDPFEALQNQIRACRICRERFGYEPHPVVFGSRTAPVMQISQAPSRNVHQTLRPFDDASGRKLRRDWYRIADEIFYDPACFLITSTAKCYPGKSPG